MTLRDIWVAKGMNSVQVAAAAHCAVATLYKMNRKEDKGIAFAIVKRVCKVLEISLDEYDKLETCPMAERYKQ